jgi:hypothetical protein
MTIHEILSLRGRWQETFAVWWAHTWRGAVLAFIFAFVARVGGALVGLDLEQRTLLSTLTIYPASFFALRWIIQQGIIKYFPGKGYLATRRMVQG